MQHYYDNDSLEFFFVKIVQDTPPEKDISLEFTMSDKALFL